ncbi:MAG TPA: chromosome segregation protein SMC, partial [Steroidobacteraceae bacterium]|nr:chromosome segregation protein SMC [Steroidobacteraceae bacterium]
LTKIKLAGFKSFVDPTQINFPSNLTGVVGPNGCGKSNVIDAVRWVMGELSAKHLRGDNMADVVFNGSSARKPVGTASVELVFDNGDGKIGGAYAGFSEISLKRVVSRDGTSSYFINGGRCRRKDITNLFLGTGLGSRSYAIIEQGMISRVIDAKAEDMRAFVEEAAGISRYKERRKETEARIADTRENLERLQDVRDEVEKQIRHLQRQAATARRYQALKEQERRLNAELLALRLRELDSGAEVHDATVRARELAMQAELATQRAAEAAIERARSVHTARGEALTGVQARYYEVGADISRLEQAIEHTRELRERQRTDLTQTQASLSELASHIARDEAQLAAVRAELAQLAPQLQGAQQAEAHAATVLEEAERALQEWQQRWEAHTQAVGAAEQTSEVERARIEQLENQLRRLTAQAQRLAEEHESVAAAHGDAELAQLAGAEEAARARSESLAGTLAAAQERVQRLRAAAQAAERELEEARAGREAVRAELTSLEALQAAALNDHAGETAAWLTQSGLSGRPRLAATLEVEPGWERAVETVLGDYLEAVCVEGLEAAAGALERLKTGRVTLIENGGGAGGAAEAGTLAARVRGSAAVRAQLAGVLTAESLRQALGARAALPAGTSLITPQGEWVGRQWLRVSRGTDQRAGVLEREHRLKALRAAAEAAGARVQQAEGGLAAARTGLEHTESEREAAQQQQQQAHRTHADLLAALQAGRGRAAESRERGARLAQDAGELERERAATVEALQRARAQLTRSTQSLEQLEAGHAALATEREERRNAVAAARSQAQALQMSARDLHVRVESRRSTESSVAVGMERMGEQRAQLARRSAELQEELASGDEPVIQAQGRLGAALELRLAVEGELAAARAALEETEATLRVHDEERLAAEQRVGNAREAMEHARLAAQETHVRRAALAEQFAETRCALAEVLAGLAAEADVPTWEQSLSEARADIERLGSVNLAAIDELKDHTQRKEYLDSQFADLTSALSTLEDAMKRIDKETRSRFEDTFERINVGLRDKFPRLFGGGHAYLELVGEDKLSAGVAVMARPPGKKNSTIHLLSGGEKALTAVALVFSIFDLNPAPFCLLDEVDAPLDEHNVGRFCDIVREMSSRVQFVFITHNKSTMELASQLIGVTMNEPGVSRLVTVDVDEAVRLAAV